MLKWLQRWRRWWQRHSVLCYASIVGNHWTVLYLYTLKMKQLDHLAGYNESRSGKVIAATICSAVVVVVHYDTILIGMAKQNSLRFFFFKRFDCLYWKWNWSNYNFDQSIEHSKFVSLFPSKFVSCVLFKWVVERGGDLHFELNCTIMSFENWNGRWHISFSILLLRLQSVFIKWKWVNMNQMNGQLDPEIHLKISTNFQTLHRPNGSKLSLSVRRTS